jgi:hypothetical protein
MNANVADRMPAIKKPLRFQRGFCRYHPAIITSYLV